jgi:hypothetical protein
MKSLTKYFGFLVPVASWGTLAVLVLTHGIDRSEPLSQFGYYPSTKLLWGISLTIGAILWYFFAKHLDTFWKYSSLCTLIAGLCYIVVGWVPYEPYVKTYLFDAHNIMITIASIFYSLPMAFIAFKKKHEKISRISQVIFFSVSFLVIGSIILRVMGFSILIVQLLVLVATSVWMILINKLILEDLYEDRKTKSIKL